MTQPYVFGWQADRAGCGYYRVEVPLAEYARRGGPCSFSTELAPEIREQADVVVGQRIVGDPPSRGWRKLCEAGEKLCVFELDDDLFNIDPSNPAFNSFTPPYLENLRGNIEAAHVVTVTTEPLADRLSHLNPDIRVVPNRVPGWLTEWERPVSDDFSLGWAGGISHAMDWADVIPQVGRLLTRNPQLHFHSVGGVFPEMLKWPLERVRTTKWLHSVEDYYKAIDFDIGVIPLKPHIFNQSKSAIKALEFAALGIPVVASACGPYENFVKHGETGFLVRRDHEWSSFIRDIYENSDLRLSMSKSARELAREHTVEGTLNHWLAAWGIEQPMEDTNAPQC